MLVWALNIFAFFYTIDFMKFLLINIRGRFHGTEPSFRPSPPSLRPNKLKTKWNFLIRKTEAKTETETEAFALESSEKISANQRN